MIVSIGSDCCITVVHQHPSAHGDDRVLTVVRLSVEEASSSSTSLAAVDSIASFFGAVGADGCGMLLLPAIRAERFPIGATGEDLVENVFQLGMDVEVVSRSRADDGHQVGSALASGNAADMQPVISVRRDLLHQLFALVVVDG